MQAQTLAEQFNDVSAELERRGHGVVVRRARAFIEAGRVAVVVAVAEQGRGGAEDGPAIAALFEREREVTEVEPGEPAVYV